MKSISSLCIVISILLFILGLYIHNMLLIIVNPIGIVIWLSIIITEIKNERKEKEMIKRCIRNIKLKKEEIQNGKN